MQKFFIMKDVNVLKITCLLLMFSFCGRLFAQIQTFKWQDVERQYIVRTPSDYQGSLPVMYFLHGLGDNITRVDAEYNFTQLANRFGWMIVVPQASNIGGTSMWNAALNTSSIDDSGFLMALLDSLAVQHPVNQDSIFFTGFSMGGFMSHRMAIEHGDRITACAPVSGLITNYMANQTAVAPVRLLHVHGTSDPVVGYNGNSQYFGGNLGLNVDGIINYWKNANKSSGEPVIDTLPDTHNDGLLFVRYTYIGDKELQHIKIIGGNHTWYSNANVYDVSLTDVVHDFFIGKGGFDKVGNPYAGSLNIFPNPASGKVRIDVASPTNIEIVDVNGKTVVRKHLDSGAAFLDIETFPAGIYFVKEENGNTSKLVVK